VSDIDTAVVDRLKVLDPKRPIGEADIRPMARLWVHTLVRSAAEQAHGWVALEVFAASRQAYSADGPMRLGLRHVFGRIACRRALWPLT
jgi:hypothetical protein